MTAPTTSSAALTTLRKAAQHNTAGTTLLDPGFYTAAGAHSAYGGDYLAAYNSALDSAAVTGAHVNTTAKVQTLVDAYNAILSLSMGYSGAPLPQPTAQQYVAIGVTGVHGAVDGGTALYLMDQCIFGISPAKVDSVAEVQAIANAAKHVMAAAGGTARQAAALNLNDFTNLGITGVTAGNLADVQHVIRLAACDTDVDTRHEIQDLINANLGTDRYSALALIANAAYNNSATTATLGATIYATAGVSGVNSSNLASINSALNSEAVSMLSASTTEQVQTIVDAYNAILHSADGVAGNTAVALSAAQFSAVGVSGISGTATDGSALHLLNDVVDGKSSSAVDTVPELQALASAAQHVIAAAGGSAASASAVTMADLRLLGVYGQDILLPVFQNAIHAATAAAVDTRAELQSRLNISIQDDVLPFDGPVSHDYVTVMHPTILA